MAKKVSKTLNEALDFYEPIATFISKGTTSNYGTFIRSIQSELDKMLDKPQILENWILPQIRNESDSSVYALLCNVKCEFEKYFVKGTMVGAVKG